MSQFLCRLSTSVKHLFVSVFLFFGVNNAVALDYVIVLDTSGSMNGAVSSKDRRQRLSVVKSALNDFLEAAPSDSHLTMIPFNSGIQTIEHFQLAIPEQRAAAHQLVDRLRATGETWLWTTVRKGLAIATQRQETDPTKPVMVWVMTDGEDTQRKLTLEKLLQEFPNVDGKRIKETIVLMGDVTLHLPSHPGVTIVSAPDFQNVIPPVVVWSPKSVREGETVEFSNISRGTYSLFQWYTNGVLAATGSLFQTKFEKAGDVRVRVVVSAKHGGENNAEATLSVLERKRVAMKPQIRASNLNLEPEQGVVFVVTTTVPPKSVSWLVNDETGGSGIAWEAKFPRAGVFQIVAVATDDHGVSERSSPLEVTVEDAKATIAFRMVKSELEHGEEAQFINESSGNLLRFSWDFGDGSTGVNRDVGHVYLNPSKELVKRNVQLTGWTSKGKEFHSAPAEIRVKPQERPVPSFEVIGEGFVTGQRIKFLNTSKGVVSGGSFWDFAGEGSSQEDNPEFAFGSPGEKKIILKVSNVKGLAEEISKLVTITQRVFAVSITWEAEMEAENTATAPDKLFFDEVPLVLIQTNGYAKPKFSRFSLLVPEALPEGAGIEVSIRARGTNGFAVGGMQRSFVSPLLVNQNARLEIGFNPNAAIGEYRADLVVRPIGAGLRINGELKEITVPLEGTIGEGTGSFGLWVVMGIIALFIVGLIAKMLRTANPELRAVMVNLLCEEDNLPQSSNLRLERHQTIYFGKDSGTPRSAQVFDLGAATFFMMHQGTQISLFQRNTTKALRVENHSFFDVLTPEGRSRKVYVAFEQIHENSNQPRS